MVEVYGKVPEYSGLGRPPSKKTGAAGMEISADCETERREGTFLRNPPEYPEARIALFVIYCFGNQGVRVIEAK